LVGVWRGLGFIAHFAKCTYHLCKVDVYLHLSF